MHASDSVYARIYIYIYKYNYIHMYIRASAVFLCQVAVGSVASHVRLYVAFCVEAQALGRFLIDLSRLSAKQRRRSVNFEPLH